MKTIIAILILVTSTVHAVLIPADRLGKWKPGVDVGVSGGIPANRTIIVDASGPPYNADKTGANDASVAIQSAINATPKGGVTSLPAGTYRITKDLALGSGRTLRGAGMNATTLMVYGGSNILSFGAQSPGWWGPLQNGIAVTGATANATTLTVPDTATFTPGLMAIFSRQASSDQYDNPVVVATGGPGGDFFRQVTKVVSKTPTTLTVSPGPFIDLAAYPVKIVAGLYAGQDGVGVEDLTIDLKNSSTFSAISWTETRDSWIKNVKITNTKNYAMSLLQCSRLEIRGCYIGPAAGGPTSNQAGVIFTTVDSCLVEDNIFVETYPCLEINTGSSGNVFAYNLIRTSNGYYAVDSNHGPHNVMNLYEGNVITLFISDAYFGSESHGTLFRNWITGIGSAGTAAPKQINWTIGLKRFTRKYSLVGNVIGMGGYSYPFGDTVSLGQPNMGNSESTGTAPPWADWGKQTGPGSFQELDTGVKADLVRKGNYSYHNSTQESLGGDALPDSLYLTAKPSFFGSLAWPPFNPAAPGTPDENAVMQKIPAGYRYVSGTGPTPTPSPTATPVPTPTPQPTPTPPVTTSPDCTKAVTITDASGAVWTFNAGRQSLRNGTWVGGGLGDLYKFVGGKVHLYNGTNWYLWNGSVWQSVAAEPQCGPTPTPSPSPSATPTPPPTPTPTPPTPTPPATISISDVQGLQQALDGKADKGHTHPVPGTQTGQ